MWEEDPGVPNLSLPQPELEAAFKRHGITAEFERLPSTANFRQETVWRLQK
jgi:hypothetical protein